MAASLDLRGVTLKHCPDMFELLAAFAAPLRLVHALVGISLAAGLLGRWVTLARAEKAARDGDLSAVRALLGASGVFERIVIPSSGAVLLLGFSPPGRRGIHCSDHYREAVAVGFLSRSCSF